MSIIPADLFMIEFAFIILLNFWIAKSRITEANVILTRMRVSTLKTCHIDTRMIVRVSNLQQFKTYWHECHHIRVLLMRWKFMYLKTCVIHLLTRVMARLHWAFLVCDSWMWLENFDCLMIHCLSRPIGNLNFDWRPCSICIQVMHKLYNIRVGWWFNLD